MVITLLDSASSSENINEPVALANDYELNGTINRAANEGAKFSLLLAMLEQDCTHRPLLEKPEYPENEALASDALAPHPASHYRSSSLRANQEYWQTCQYTSQLIGHNQLEAAKLWLAMHPEPLSQNNNAQQLDDDILANCSINTQNRLQQTESKVVKVDETGLYDILQEFELTPQ